MSGRIFISYSREDKEFAGRLVQDLTVAGVNTWLDIRDIVAGQRWDSAVQAALRDCPYFLVVLSPASVESDNVLDEVAYAVDKKKPIFPVFAVDCEIPYRLYRVQYVDFRSGYEDGLQALLNEFGRAGLVQAEPAPDSGARPDEPAAAAFQTPAFEEFSGEEWPKYAPFYSLLEEENSPLEAYGHGIILRGELYFRFGRPIGKFLLSHISLLITDIHIEDLRLLDGLFEKMTSVGREELLLVTSALSEKAIAQLGKRRKGVQTTAIAIGRVGRHMWKVLTDLAILTGSQLVSGTLYGSLTRQSDTGLLVIDSSDSAALSNVTVSDLGSWPEISGDAGHVAFLPADPSDFDVYRARRDQLLAEMERDGDHVDGVFDLDRLARLAGSARQDTAEVELLNKRIVLALDRLSVDALPLFYPPLFDFAAGGESGTTITIGRGYASPYLVTDPESGAAVQEKCDLLLFAGRLTLERVLPLLERRLALRRDGLVIIANSADPSLEATLSVNKLRGFMNSLLITLDPSDSDTRKMLERTAEILNATLFDESTDPAAITLDRLGPAARVIAHEYETVITLP
jgi:hypothetical protein